METSPIIPPLGKYFGEARVVTGWLRGRRLENEIAAHYPGDGRPIMVLPGLFTTDNRTKMLRRVHGKAGYHAVGWGLGRNMPIRADIIERLGFQIEAVQARTGAAVTLIGWSLGGLIARAYAQHAPAQVAGVITLGSPFSGDPRSNRAWRAYEMFADHKVDSPPIDFDRSAKPQVPTVAIWSANDGIIAAQAARGLPHERDHEIEIGCGHLAMGCAPEALKAILKLLGEGLPSAR